MEKETVIITLTLNHQLRTFSVTQDETLLHLIREQARMKGTKHGCDNGACGACTVLLDGYPVNSCCVFAVQTDGHTIETIESMETPEALHPIQQAFVDAGAVQCGYCMPGMALTAKSLLAHNPEPTAAEVRQAMAGNICRCTGYAKIEEAVLNAATSLKKQGRTDWQ